MNRVVDYYRLRESKWGYKFVLGGVRHFGYYPEGKSISRSVALRNMMDEVGNRIKLPEGSQVLDAGCGEGKTAIRMAERFGYSLTGVDLLQESIKLAKDNAKKSSAKVIFQVSNFMHLPFDDASFDCVYALETFTHAPDDKKALREFIRVLRPGGRLIIFDYETAKLEAIPDKKIVNSMRAVGHGTSAPGLTNFTHGYFKRTFSEGGLKQIRVDDLTDNVMPMLKYFRKLSFLVHPLVRLLGNEAKYPNTTAGSIGVGIAKNGWWKFVAAEATKPKR
jgi:ubiquinone/menaquinone biosynthesis C-methylase UbiE